MKLEAGAILPDPKKISGTAPIRVAVIGQPNTGKSSLFNRLTGLRQRVGNYPGVTVERKEGRGRLGEQDAIFLDLPGTYSLNAVSPDEQITVESLSGRKSIGPRPDVILCVVEASRLERSIIPAFQAVPLGIPVVVALNFSDEARKRGVRIDLALLESRIGVPVIPTVAKSGEGLKSLRAAMLTAIQDKKLLRPPDWPEAVRAAFEYLEPHVTDENGEPCAFTTQRVLFDTNGRAFAALGGDPEHMAAILEESRKRLRAGGHHPATAEPVLLFAHVQKLLDGVLIRQQDSLPDLTRRLDSLLAHPFLGLVLFATVMFLVFQAVYSWSSPLMDGIENLTSWTGEQVSAILPGTPMLQSLVVDGMIAGIGSVLIFLPQILILTLLIALLEDSGYLARAAFLVDRLFGWAGLNGKSFVPLMSSYACAIPGIMAARTIEDNRTRLVTIFIAPLMSCSARLPVYVVMIGAFVEPIYGSTGAALALFAMHILGPIVAMPIAFIMQRMIFKGAAPPFLLELPPYRIPSFYDVLHRVWQRGQRFLSDAGTVIFFITVVIWALLYFPRPSEVAEKAQNAYVNQLSTSSGMTHAEAQQLADNPETPEHAALENSISAAYLEQSYLGRAGQAVQPAFAPAGFDWKITIAVLASFPAREVVIATLGVIYNLGAEQDEESTDLRQSLRASKWKSGPKTGQPVFTVATAFSIMVFFALCMQCGATVAIIKAESGWRWALSAFVIMTILAWIGSVVVYQGITFLYSI